MRGPAKHLTVLVADPDVESTVKLARRLEWSGYEVLTTGDAADAMAIVEEKRPDVVVLEAMMNGTSGYGMVRRLREQPCNRLMPIILIGERAGKLDHDFAFTVGADDYLKKPFRPTDLVARIRKLAPDTGAGRPLVA
jgi:two-component system phosphate regulon response regulator PhoB